MIQYFKFYKFKDLISCFVFFFMFGGMKNKLDGTSGRHVEGLVVNSVVFCSRWTRAGPFCKAWRHSVHLCQQQGKKGLCLLVCSHCRMVSSWRLEHRNSTGETVISGLTEKIWTQKVREKNHKIISINRKLKMTE